MREQDRAEIGVKPIQHTERKRKVAFHVDTAKYHLLLEGMDPEFREFHQKVATYHIRNIQIDAVNDLDILDHLMKAAKHLENKKFEEAFQEIEAVYPQISEWKDTRDPNYADPPNKGDK